MNHLDLFSGIGGFALAAEWVGWKTKAFCEQDKYCQKVLNKNFKGIPIHGDIRTIPGIGEIDIITGGFPCQPFSVAGKKKGTTDDRYFWPEMLRVIEQEKPAWVVGENVPGIVNMALDTCITDLEAQNYTVQSFIIPACAVQALHRRDRVWIIAHANSAGQQPSQTTGNKAGNNTRGIRENVADTERKQHQGGKQKQIYGKPDLQRKPRRGCEDGAEQWATEPGMGRVVDGLPGRVDRIKGLGNAVVTQLVYQIFKIIDQCKYH